MVLFITWADRTMKQFITEYLSFTRKERTGLFVLLLLIIFFSILPFLFPFFIHKKQIDHAAFEKAIAALKIKQADSSSMNYKKYDDDREPNYYPRKNYNYTANKAELFYFDPNTLSAEGWKKLGIREKTIGTIQNYTAKGGRFRKADDIAKIWGLHDDEVRRLMPFVVIKEKATDPFVKKEWEKKPYERMEKKIDPFDINVADTSAFIALPGIGSKLAARIVAFREKLGGFYAVEQIGETYGLPDSVFQKSRNLFLLPHPAVKQLSINSATLDELKAHPYIRYNLAGAIVQYRSQHGNYRAVADIKKIMMVTEDIYKKAAPYLSVE
jgi:competence protein ComEA